MLTETSLASLLAHPLDASQDEQKARLLKLIKKRSKAKGDSVKLHAQTDWPRLGARGIAGMNILLPELAQDGLIETGSDNAYDDVALTNKGWQQAQD